jgi:hypothetical protein
MRGHVAATVLILLGSYFLLSNLGLINVSIREIIMTWWPLVMIAAGVSMLYTPKDRK